MVKGAVNITRTRSTDRMQPADERHPAIPVGKATTTIECTHPCPYCGTALEPTSSKNPTPTVIRRGPPAPPPTEE